jgi:hypothetical protein
MFSKLLDNRGYNQYLIFTVVLFSGLITSCKKDTSSSYVPEITVGNTLISVYEDAPAPAVQFQVILSGATGKTVTIDYMTTDSTALAGKDYVAETSGKLVFKAGETSKEIKIDILQDSAQKQDVYFRIVLSNPVNGVMKSKGTTIRIVNVDYSKLIWSDEFSTGPLNTSTWNYELGATGWGNNELENYTNSLNNVHIDSGYLHISALNPSGTSYTSGRITTKGKKAFTYGKIELRAKLPEGKGIWPALWMLGSNFSSVGWPGCGEIDIMELLGDSPSVTHGALHWDSNGHVSRTNQFTLDGGKFSSSFHIFSLKWTPNKLIWLVDNREFFTLTRTEISGFPFDLPQFFIFNVAVGGNWPGSPDQTTVFPQHMIVDYVRVYQ